jgi:Beta-propeller repeat
VISAYKRITSWTLCSGLFVGIQIGSPAKAQDLPSASSGRRDTSVVRPINKLGSPNTPVYKFASPLAFEPNVGQADPRFQFLAHGPAYSAFLSNTEASFTLSGRKSLNPAHSNRPVEQLNFKMRFLDAKTNSRASGVQLLRGKTNYLVGSDPAQWHTDVLNYGKVQFEEVYPGIDLVYYGINQRLEYDLKVAPGASVKSISMDLPGAEDLHIDAKGNLIFRCGDRSLSILRPSVYQLSLVGKRESVKSSWTVGKNGRLGFDVQKYDRSRALVIDPTFNFPLLAYIPATSSTANAVAIDPANSTITPAGSIYVTGSAALTIPIPNSSATTLGTFGAAGITPVTVAYVIKYPAIPHGTPMSPIYTTYIGGNTDAQGNTPSTTGRGIAVNASGNAIVVGYTTAHGSFPAGGTGCSVPIGVNSCSGGFILELSPTGNASVYSSYVTGAGVGAITLDPSGNAYITGSTYGPGTLSSGVAQPVFGGGTDVFVSKIGLISGASSWYTYLGGSGNESGSGIALDSALNVYVTGVTTNVNASVGPGTFPLVNPLQAGYGGGSGDAFVTELNNSGSSFIFSSFLGGSGLDEATSIAVDQQGSVYVTGSTSSSNFPTNRPLQATLLGGNTNTFLTKLFPAGPAFVYSTYLWGSGGNSSGNGVSADSAGNAYITGVIRSEAGSSIGTIDPNILNLSTNSIQPQCGDSSSACSSGDAFVASISTNGDAFLYFTYIGGDNADFGNAIVLDSSSNCSQSTALQAPFTSPCAYVVGDTQSDNLLTTDSSSPTSPAAGFLAEVPSLAIPVCSENFSVAGLLGQVVVKCISNFQGGAGAVNWGDSTPTTQISIQNASQNPQSAPVTHQYAQAGNFNASASMTNSVSATPTTFGTLFPISVQGPISVMLSCTFNGTTCANPLTAQYPNTLQFNAQVQNASDTSVTWSVNGVIGGSSTLGTISNPVGSSPGGVYMPPQGLANPIPVQILATSNSATNNNQTVSPSTTPLTVEVSPPISVSIVTNPVSSSPATLQAPNTLQFVSTVKYAASDQTVTWYVNNTAGGNNTIGSISPAGLYIPPTTFTPSTIPISVTIKALSNQDLTTFSPAFSITVNPPVYVVLSGAPTSVVAGSASSTITATVASYATSPNVTWSLKGNGCNGSPCGSINPSGPTNPGTKTTYTPPTILPTSNFVTDTVIATSVADPSQSASAPINVTPATVSISLNPTSAIVTAGQSATITFVPMVTGSGNTAVTWKVSGTGCNNGPCGSISISGIYTPPNAIAGTASVTDVVTATAQADPTKSATASVTINIPISVSITPNGTTSVEPGQMVNFISTVLGLPQGSSGQLVTWKVSGTGCNNGPCGTINQSGQYIAPATIKSSQTDTVSATVIADPTKVATAALLIFLPATAPPPSSVSVTNGKSAQYAITLSPGTGDPLHPLNLSCANLPNGTACQFSPNPVAIGGTSFTVVVTTTPATTAASIFGKGLSVVGLFPLLALFMPSFRNKSIRRKLAGMILLIILCVLIPSLVTACSTGGSFGSNQLPSLSSTPSGSFTIKVVGQPVVPSGQIQPASFQVTTLPLVVN